jgi:hypothetical protein
VETLTSERVSELPLQIIGLDPGPAEGLHRQHDSREVGPAGGGRPHPGPQRPVAEIRLRVVQGAREDLVRPPVGNLVGWVRQGDGAEHRHEGDLPDSGPGR